ncbi:hypothetical protein O181_072238 [Austropuccinia psidii MF-1]|uniref:Uncharacterized protein n=1 Tax=Austropuccinia psidii MF-1 TaxID=1389203 RepID=A0A9Q3I8Z2_9BASI|nr:hypothetical protein [Austropuccinia psidii MF-1]
MAREHSAWANCCHVLSPMGFKRQKQNQPNPLQQDSPIPSLPCKQTQWHLTPGPSGTQWSEDLFHGNQPKFDLISTFDSSEITVPPFVEPSQTNEPPIPGPSPSSEPHKEIWTHEPEPEGALTQSTEEPFTCPTPPHCVIIINDTPVRSPFPSCSPSLPVPLRTLVPSSPHSHNEACQEFTDL